jgi:hypothetical protein
MESQVVSYIHPSSVSSVHMNTLGSTFVPFVTVCVKGLTKDGELSLKGTQKPRQLEVDGNLQTRGLKKRIGEWIV